MIYEKASLYRFFLFFFFFLLFLPRILLFSFFIFKPADSLLFPKNLLMISTRSTFKRGRKYTYSRNWSPREAQEHGFDPTSYSVLRSNTIHAYIQDTLAFSTMEESNAWFPSDDYLKKISKIANLSNCTTVLHVLFTNNICFGQPV